MRRFSSLAVSALLLAISAPLFAEDSPAKSSSGSQAYATAVDKAIAYLQKTQNADGSFGVQKTPAITAICITGVLKNGRSPDDPFVAKSLKYITGFVREDGGIYKDDSPVQNYETSLSVVCLAAANKDGRYNKEVKAAEAYLKKIQWSGGEENPKFGGAGYGKKNRPDLSNTAMLLDALKATGANQDDPAVKAALIFVSRCQNLESEHNTTAAAAKVNDGGFYYAADPPESFAERTPDMPEGALRSYGSMTYAGLKSMIYAGLTKDDKRVKAAVAWAQKNYDLKQNPGMGTAGLFYYFQTLAKALDAVGDESFTDAKGVAHKWRAEIATELAALQKADGSWANDNKRWVEDDPALVTGYCLLTLSYCRSK